MGDGVGDAEAGPGGGLAAEGAVGGGLVQVGAEPLEPTTLLRRLHIVTLDLGKLGKVHNINSNVITCYELFVTFSKMSLLSSPSVVSSMLLNMTLR